MEIQDKVVIVTGASEGIGLATAQKLAAQGAKVVLAARSQGKLEQIARDLIAQGYAATGIPTDMRSQAQVQRLIAGAHQQYGRIDALINNAGQSVIGQAAVLDLDAYRQVIELNIFGVLYAMQAVIPFLREAGGGLIVNISSMVSKMSLPGLSGYASTKSALNMISQTARGELAPENIRVITVFPRSTSTRFRENAIGDIGATQPRRGGAIVIDPPETVADKILSAMVSEIPEQYMDAAG